MAGSPIIFQGFHHLKAVFERHHNVADDQIGYIFEGFFDARLAVVGKNPVDIVLSNKRSNIPPRRGCLQSKGGLGQWRGGPALLLHQTGLSLQ